VHLKLRSPQRTTVVRLDDKPGPSLTASLGLPVFTCHNE
jgi:hypothetical protein